MNAKHQPTAAAAAADTIAQDTLIHTIPDLLDSLNLYVDELVHRPTFHGFKDLPLKFRHKAYEEYFSDNAKAILGRMWPTITIDRDLSMTQQSREKPEPFLPSLCMVSHGMKAEVTLFVVGSATFQIKTSIPMKRLISFLGRPSMSKEADPVANIRKLCLSDTNDLLAAFMSRLSQGFREKQAKSTYE